MRKSGIIAIVVNWNQKRLLLECLTSIYASDFPEIKVIVVDNASSDGSAEAVERTYPDAILIRNSTNMGFAAANNQGLERAYEEDASYVMLLNSDATVDNQAIKTLHDYLEKHPAVAAVAPYIFYHDRPDIIWFGGGIISIWRGWIGHRFIRKSYRADKHRVRSADYLTGCAILARTDMMGLMKGFDESFGLYAEDVDLSLRIRAAGSELHVVPDAHAYHRVSASTGGTLSPLKAFYRGRSTSILFRKYTRCWEIPTLILLGFINLVSLSIVLTFKGKFWTVTALWKGIICGLLNQRYIPEKYKLGFN